jgi:hypothetical protein
MFDYFASTQNKVLVLALAQLLIKKKVITLEEYEEMIREASAEVWKEAQK